MVHLLHGMRMEWNGNEIPMFTWQNKWEWECAGMSLMCLLGKINGNEE